MARSTAEQHARATSDFFTGVSHEMRTPLQAITGFTELLGTLDLDTVRRAEALHHIDRAAHHLLALVDDTQDLARLDAGVLPLFPEVVDVGDAVDEVAELLGPLADQEGVRLTTRIGDEQVAADPRRLLAGADQPGGQRDPARPHRGRRRAGDRPARAAGTACGSRSATTATASRSEQLERLFRPFERLGLDAVRDARDGTGLGLVLSRGLTEAMERGRPRGRHEPPCRRRDDGARLVLPAAR